MKGYKPLLLDPPEELLEQLVEISERHNLSIEEVILTLLDFALSQKPAPPNLDYLESGEARNEEANRSPHSRSNDS